MKYSVLLNFFAYSWPVKKTKSRVIYAIIVVRRKACLGFVLGKNLALAKVRGKEFLIALGFSL